MQNGGLGLLGGGRRGQPKRTENLTVRLRGI